MKTLMQRRHLIMKLFLYYVFVLCVCVCMFETILCHLQIYALNYIAKGYSKINKSIAGGITI